MEKFVDVILPLPLHACFTYSLPEDMAESVQIGCRVVVPFGRKKYYTAIVQNIHYSAPAGYEVKEVSALLDAHPILLSEQFRFWDWLAGLRGKQVQYLLFLFGQLHIRFEIRIILHDGLALQLQA